MKKILSRKSLSLFFVAVFLGHALGSAHGQQIIDVGEIVASSTIAGDALRVAGNLKVDANGGLGLDTSTGIYTISHEYGRNGWMTASQSTAASRSQVWLAFDLESATDIASMHIWNFFSNQDTNNRQTKNFDVYIATAGSVGDLDFGEIFSTTNSFEDIKDLVTLEKVTLDAFSLSRPVTSGLSEQINLDASGAQWVVFTNFVNYGAGYLGLGKVAFVDEVVTAGIVPTNAKASTRIDEKRDVTNTISRKGLSAINIFDDTWEFTHKYTVNADAIDDGYTSWLSENGKNSNLWLAYELGAAYDLEGLYAWNYSREGDTLNRGINKFDMYVVTQSDLDALGMTFDEFFSTDKTLNDLITALLDPDDPTSTVLTKVNSENYEMAQAQAVNNSQQQEFFFDDIAEDVVWAMMAAISNHGSSYMGLGQIQFIGSLSENGESNVPEPAAWLLMAVGLAGLAAAKKRKLIF